MFKEQLLKVAKPILFNTQMVKAILEGRKTVTRRYVKYKYDNTEMKMHTDKYGTRLIEIQKDVEGETHGKNPDGSTWHKLLPYIEKKAPFRKGDILYVRETWCWCPCWDCGMDTEEHNCCYEGVNKLFNHEKGEWGCYGYKASFEDNEYPSVDTWHPSIHMPKEAARIFLKVKGVRLEQLQDICGRGTPQGHVTNIAREGLQLQAVMENYQKQIDDFKQLWNSTIKKSDCAIYGWDANPYVWVIEFERIDLNKESD